jgi:hypothetical protein
MEQANQEELERRWRASRNRRLIAEGVVVATMFAGFLFMLIASSDWSFGAALFPRIAGFMGVATVVVYVTQRAREELRPRLADGSRVLDIGWADFGGDKAGQRARTVAFLATTGGLWVSIWLIGFHIAVPAYLILVLMVYGKVRWYWGALAASISYGLIIGVYDTLLHTAWNDPVLFDFVRGLPGCESIEAIISSAIRRTLQCT